MNGAIAGPTEATVSRPPRWLNRAGQGAFTVVVAVMLVLGMTWVAPGGIAAAKTPKIKKPGAPTTVVAHPIEGGALVTWGAPASDGGSPITGYSVNAGHTTCSTSGAFTCAVTGLTDGHSYFVRVRASNVAGLGRSSAPVKFVADQAPDCGDLVPGANLQYCNFHGDDLDGLNLAGANLWGADIVDASFDGADLAGATLPYNLTSVSFDGANLENADLAGAYNYDSSYVDTDLTDADLSDSVVIYDDFTGATLTGLVPPGGPWIYSICPDGTNSNDDGNTCLNNLG